jgi:hypothetical protein
LALADTIQLGSFASGAVALGDANTAMNYAGYSATSMAPSSGTASTYTLSPDTVWAAPVANSTWVGFAPTAGPVGTSNPAFGYYTFTTSFTAAVPGGAPYDGTLSLMADDTAEVLLNGTVLVPFGFLGSDAHCADGSPSCLVADNVSLSNLVLLGGTDANTLTFVVQQAGTGPTGGTLDPSGVDFDASLSAVPEPSTFALMAIGALAIGGATFGKKALTLAEARSTERS